MISRIVLALGFKPWFRHTAKCAVLGCDSPKAGRLFCKFWWSRHQPRLFRSRAA